MPTDPRAGGPGTRMSDAELSATLRMLMTVHTPEPAHLDKLRTTVLTTIDRAAPTNTPPSNPRTLLPAPATRSTVRPSRSLSRPALLAAVIVLLVVGGALAAPAIFARSPAESAAAAALNKAAAAADRAAAAGTDIIPAGKYRYVDTVGWAASMGDHAYLQQGRWQQWIPADIHDTWLERRSTTNERRWINGTEADAAALNLAPAGITTTEPDLTGPCHSYFNNLCTGDGTWSSPTLGWIAGLPTTPEGLYDKLYADSEGFGQSDEAEMLVEATEALRSNVLPAATRATLYRAMAMIPGVDITDGRANLNGRTGVAFAVSSPYIREETIIDTTTGDYIGTRQTVLGYDDISKIPAGTVINYTSITTTIVDKIGATS